MASPLNLVCDHCPEQAAVIVPGECEERAGVGILLRAAKPHRFWCMPCAVAAGYPWLASEQPRTTRRRRAPAAIRP